MNKIEPFISRCYLDEEDVARLISYEVITQRSCVQLPFNGNRAELKIRRETAPDGSLRYCASRKYDPTADGTPEEYLEKEVEEWSNQDSRADFAGKDARQTACEWLRSEPVRQIFRAWCSDMFSAGIPVSTHSINYFILTASGCVRSVQSLEQFTALLTSAMEEARQAGQAGRPIDWCAFWHNLP